MCFLVLGMEETGLREGERVGVGGGGGRGEGLDGCWRGGGGGGGFRSSGGGGEDHFGLHLRSKRGRVLHIPLHLLPPNRSIFLRIITFALPFTFPHLYRDWMFLCPRVKNSLSRGL